MKQSDVKFGSSMPCIFRLLKDYAVDSVLNLWQCVLFLIGLICCVVVLLIYPIYYPFGKYILLPRAIKRAEKATEEQMDRMFPDKVKTDETNK